MKFIACLSLLTLALVSCSSSPTAHPATPAPRHYLANLAWGIVGVPDVPTLDPALASDPTSISVASLVYGGLVRLDRHLQVRPDGAASWHISRDGKVYTFSIRPNLRFAGGRRVTARDFADALERALGAEGSTGTASFYLSLITVHRRIVRGSTRVTRGILVINPSTLSITLTRPAAHFLAELAFPASFVPDPAILRRYGPTWTDHAAGFGPYTVRLWRHSRFLSLERNPYYYGGKPAVKRITIHFYGTASAVVAYRRGALEVVSGFQPGETFLGKSTGMRRVAGLALDYLAFNTNRTPFRRINARRAFAAAWTPHLAAAVIGRAGFSADGLLPAGFGLSGLGWRPDISAGRYLAAAHYPHGNGFPALSLITPQTPYLIALAHDLARTWALTLQVDVLVRPLNSLNYSRVLNAHAFDLALVQWGADYPDAQDFLGTQLGSSPDNLTGWSKASYVHAVALADSYNPADPRRRQLEQQAATIATRAVAIVPLDEPALAALTRPGLAGIALTGLGTVAVEPMRLGVSR